MRLRNKSAGCTGVEAHRLHAQRLCLAQVLQAVLEEDRGLRFGARSSQGGLKGLPLRLAVVPHQVRAQHTSEAALIAQ
jgi:hypothetical protein